MSNDFVVPKASGQNKRVRNLCEYKEHDWTGQYYDGWLFLDCTKCEARNIQHQLTRRQVIGLTYGGYNWDVNKLPIRINRFGNQITRNGHLTWGYLEERHANRSYYESVKGLSLFV